MSRHTVTVKEIDDWLNRDGWLLAASSGGQGTNKRLEVSHAGMFRVTDHGDIKYIGGDKSAAIDAYNVTP